MLSKMFLAGAKNLENKKEWINELNVFPVPDGDTGTNMTMTIMSAAREVSALGDNADMAALCKAISSGSLRGARGNSGVILSQLFRGFTKSIKEEQVLDIPVLTRAFEKAVETAYKAVMKPKEGTILTVAKGASDKAKELCEDGADDLEQFLGTVIEHARYVLSQTPEMLPVLKQAGVVDSGGQGLVEVLSGAYDAFLGKEIDLTYSPATAKQRYQEFSGSAPSGAWATIWPTAPTAGGNDPAPRQRAPVRGIPPERKTNKKKKKEGATRFFFCSSLCVSKGSPPPCQCRGPAPFVLHEYS